MILILFLSLQLVESSERGKKHFLRRVNLPHAINLDEDNVELTLMKSMGDENWEVQGNASEVVFSLSVLSSLPLLSVLPKESSTHAFLLSVWSLFSDGWYLL